MSRLITLSCALCGESLSFDDVPLPEIVPQMRSFSTEHQHQAGFRLELHLSP